MDENESENSLKINGPVIDLFDPQLPILGVKQIKPGTQSFLYDLSTLKSDQPKVLAAAARIYEEKVTGNGYSFLAKSPSKTINVMRIKLPQKPIEVRGGDDGNLGKTEISKNIWDQKTRTLLLQFENKSEGVPIKIRWK